MRRRRRPAELAYSLVWDGAPATNAFWWFLSRICVILGARNMRHGIIIVCVYWCSIFEFFLCALIYRPTCWASNIYAETPLNGRSTAQSGDTSINKPAVTWVQQVLEDRIQVRKKTYFAIWSLHGAYTRVAIGGLTSTGEPPMNCVLFVVAVDLVAKRVTLFFDCRLRTHQNRRYVGWSFVGETCRVMHTIWNKPMHPPLGNANAVDSVCAYWQNDGLKYSNAIAGST